MKIIGNNNPWVLPWACSQYSWKVAKTPKREVLFCEKEADLQEVLIENLVGDTLTALERMTGLSLIDRDNLVEFRILVPKNKHDDGPSLMRKLAKMVVEKKKKVDALDYLRIRKEWVILQIKESPEYEGRLYFNEYYDCEFNDPFDRMKQEFEAYRQFLLWLDIVIEQLTIEQEVKVDLAMPIAAIGGNKTTQEAKVQQKGTIDSGVLSLMSGKDEVFSDYLTDEGKEILHLIPSLTKNKGHYAAVVTILNSENLLKEGVISLKQDVHLALVNSFGKEKVGDVSLYKKKLKEYDAPNGKEKIVLDTIRKQIKLYFTSKNY